MGHIGLYNQGITPKKRGMGYTEEEKAYHHCVSPHLWQRGCLPLTDFTHEAGIYDPDGALLHWLHITVGNAKAFVPGTYHGLSKEYLQAYLDEFCYRFSRRYFEGDLLGRLAIAVANSIRAAD